MRRRRLDVVFRGLLVRRRRLFAGALVGVLRRAGVFFAADLRFATGAFLSAFLAGVFLAVLRRAVAFFAAFFFAAFFRPGLGLITCKSNEAISARFPSL